MKDAEKYCPKSKAAWRTWIDLNHKKGSRLARKG